MQNQKVFATFWLLVVAISGLALGQDCGGLPANRTPAAVEASALGATKNVHRAGSLYFAGQFEPADIAAIKDAGITRVITLRQADELNWDERAVVEMAGLEYHAIPFRSADDLNDTVFDQVRKLLRQGGENGTLFHCASANRVGGVWLAYRVLDEGVPWETAVAEAQTIGMKSDAILTKAQAYVAAQEAKPVIGPDLNRDFLDPNLDVDEWIKRFEVESREIFAQRLEILKQSGVKAGFVVADIGAGTGLFTRLFANEVQSDGHVLAVEISPAFLTHINQMARELQVPNITSVLCREDSIGLPKASIDMAFVCDTYHHFAFPKSTLASIMDALRPAGILVVVDFERIPGQSRDWVLQHVRAGKDEVRKEIEAAGFRFIDEPKVAGLEENYMLRFEKPAQGQ